MLAGYSGSYGRGEYCYTVIWKKTTRWLVPYSWTSHYLVNHVYVEEIKATLERRRKYEEEQKKIKNEEKKRKAKERYQKVSLAKKALKTRLQTLKAEYNDPIDLLLDSGILGTYHSEFFTEVEEVNESIDAVKVTINHIRRHIQYISLSDIKKIPKPVLSNDSSYIVKKDVDTVLAHIINRIVNACNSPICLVKGSRNCPSKSCQRCCTHKTCYTHSYVPKNKPHSLLCPTIKSTTSPNYIPNT